MASIDPALLLDLATALGAGLLIGSVRERRSVGPDPIAGIRTHALTALAGAIGLVLGPAPFAVVLAAVAAFAVASYVTGRADDPGVTGEIALIVTCLLGALTVRTPALATGLAVIAAGLLYAKAPLHRLVREVVSEREVHDGLVLLAAALVALPLIPDRAMGPYALFNPATLWRLVVLVMAIGAIGHVALRLIGARWGLAVSGFFAGFVSSTVAIAGFGQKARGGEVPLGSAVGGAVMASLASVLLFFPLLGASSVATLAATWLELAAPVAALGVVGLITGRRVDRVARDAGAAEQPMFHLRKAFGLSALMTAVLLAAGALGHAVGGHGAMATAVLASPIDVHASGVTLARLFDRGALTTAEIRWCMVALLAVTSVSRTIVAAVSGGARFALAIGAALAGAVGLAAAVALLQQLGLLG